LAHPNPVWFYNAACGHDIFLKGDMVKISTGLLGLLVFLAGLDEIRNKLT
jgi:hypothetical protein